MAKPHSPGNYPLRSKIGLLGGPLIFFAMLLIPAPEGLPSKAWLTAATGLFMAIWWVTEAIPIPATALLPIVLLPLMGVTSIKETLTPYANELIFLFMGGFMIAKAMERWNLHKRIALLIIERLGSGPHAIILGFALASAFLSMWVSNTATALMMLPIALSIIHLVKDQAQDETLYHNFFTALLLIVAYGCNIGGIGTLIGTPPNALLAGFFSETYQFEISFFKWLMAGMPVVILGLPLAYFLLTRILYPLGIKDLPGGAALIKNQRIELGPVTYPEKVVALVFGTVAVLWVIRPFLLEPVLPGISDAGIAIFGALLLFVLPENWSEGNFILTWESAVTLPWGLLILFGGGLSLASAFQASGLAEWIGNSLSGLETWPVLALICFLVIIVVFLTEITSNTATTAALLPVIASAAIGLGQNPLLLTFPAAIAASCAFMLPVATPPNAVVFGSDHITIPQMAKAGFWLNLIMIIVITTLSYTLLLWIFNIQINEVPLWITSSSGN